MLNGIEIRGVGGMVADIKILLYWKTGSKIPLHTSLHKPGRVDPQEFVDRSWNCFVLPEEL